ncbi:MFS general substrate transporter [Ascodesmis nigricans]|uniref:MFS general substrate transporter n=1 Tax=Ascodesmis nigricans TaxID=341454 RepID=A0A4S2MR42_9PEZI|nr:MFS general substrate transporter [Ascodesmis nigricans]
MADLSEAAATELQLQRALSRQSEHEKQHPNHHHHHNHPNGETQLNEKPSTITSGSGSGTAPQDTESACSLSDELTLEGAENPYNWSTSRRMAITLAVCIHSLAATMGSSLFTPGIIEMQMGLKMKEIASYAALSVYVAGMAVGPVLFAPMSEVYGRRFVLVPAWIVFLGFTAGCAASKNTASMLVCRLFAGVFASPTLTVAGGMVTDLWPRERLGYVAMGLFTMTAFLGPVLGPIIGGYLVQNLSADQGWRWCFWFLLIFSGACSLNWSWIPETYTPTLLEKKRRAIPEDIRPPLKPGAEASWELYKNSITRPIMLLVLDPVVFLSSLYVSFVFAIIYLFLGAYPVIFRGRYGMTPGESGLAFLGIGFGVILVFPCAGYANAKYLELKKARGIEPHMPFPEGRLLMAIFGAFLVPVSLFWFAWTGKKEIHWIVPVLSGVPFGLGLTTVFISLVSYLAEAYYEFSASAIAANTILRSLMAAAFPLFVSKMYRDMKPEWASSTLGFVALAFIPVPWLFWKYGHKLRERSKFKP